MTSNLDPQLTPLHDTDETVIPSESDAPPKRTQNVEEVRVSGSDLGAKIKELLHQGNIRRIVIKNEHDLTLLEIPVSVGIVGGIASIALIPEIVAISVVGAMFAHLTLVIERKDPDRPTHPE